MFDPRSGLRLIAAVAVLSDLAGAAVALEPGEFVLTAVPTGFKQGYHAADGRQAITEYVPDGETVENWSRMVTVQIFRGATVSPGGFARGLGTRWTGGCAGGEAGKAHEGMENGFPVSVWTYLCPLNTATGKPENTWLKAIGGSDTLYVVQYAYRREMGMELIGPAVQYLRTITACDTRRADRPCPAGM